MIVVSCIIFCHNTKDVDAKKKMNAIIKVHGEKYCDKQITIYGKDMVGWLKPVVIKGNKCTLKGEFYLQYKNGDYIKKKKLTLPVSPKCKYIFCEDEEVYNSKKEGRTCLKEGRFPSLDITIKNGQIVEFVFSCT